MEQPKLKRHRQGFRASQHITHEWITENARLTFVSAKVSKTKVPTGGLARLSPHQVPGSGVVLGVRADTTSLSCRRLLDVLSRTPCARRPFRPPAKGTGTGSPLRGIAATAAMSRSDEPYGIPCTRA
ncbi:hypothetical protein KHP57_18225 [Algiphilus sp. NNCM1]|nr:hypothetical protein [Algiphilus acroporae]